MTMAADHASPTTPLRQQFDAVAHENVPLCRDHFRLVLRVDGFPPTAPGQFVQIACRDLDQLARDDREIDWRPDAPAPISIADRSRDELTSPQAMLRRPFSLAGRRDLPDGTTSEIDIIHRVVGVGTDWLSRLAAGDGVNILGPLGNRFAMPAPDQPALLIGGGVGIPPMLYLADAIAQLPDRTAPTIAIAGATNRDLLPLTLRLGTVVGDDAQPRMIVEEFARHGIATVIATDDGSLGFRGYVTQALEQWLSREVGGDAVGSDAAKARHDSVTASLPTASPLLYTCGPEPMMKRVADIALSRGLECQVAVERAMACGIGTCQSCCIRVRKPDPSKPPLAGSDWCWRLACTDGPIFRVSDLLW
jgi:dihydroorotate dehydrogenase electron transfer subunit